MMDNFSQILQRFSIATEAPSTNSDFGDAMHFKVQVNFDISLFEGQIYIDTLEKRLSLL
jgi:hypothetical protein